MKSLTALSRVLLLELGEWCHTSTSRDFKTVAARLEHEGSSFLTITLPSFGKAIERSLDLGYLAHDSVTFFKWRNGLPEFMQGFLELVFDRSSGLLLDNPSIDAIRCIRQFTLAFAKIELPCSEERKQRALTGYVECELELHSRATKPLPLDGEELDHVGMLLWSELFATADRKVFDGDLLPKHGPGKTADRLTGNGKYNQSEWTDRLEQWFPYGDYALPSWRHFHDATVKFLEPGQERPSKVTLVPKTLSSPRIIALEPTCMQYTQQALLEMMQESIRANDTARWLICSDSQAPNRALALEGSLYGKLATLDLSEASDRVSNQQVIALLRHFPSLAGAVQACRTTKADVPDRGIIPLAKFASMGSALCFPFESIVFSTLVFVGIQRALGRPLTRKDIQSMRGKVRVYGDDIIVPVVFVDHVIATLTDYGMRVNASKSFWTGRFRESCGGDYYAGVDVSIVRVRSMLPPDSEHVEEIVSTVSLRNHLYEAGYRRTVKWLDKKVAAVLPVYPRVSRQSPALGRWTDDGNLSVDRVHPDLQKPLVEAFVVTPRLPASKLDGVGALTKYFLKRVEEPYSKEHLLRAGRPSSVDIKKRWVSVT